MTTVDMPPDEAALLDAVRSIVDRGDQAAAIRDQAHAVGGCERPIRVAGRGRHVDTATGEIVGDWSTVDMPDGTLAVRCKDRRRSRCEPCSRLYQDDAYQLTRAGLAGGKGIPDSVAAHPAMFVTLTAPSFGLVHGRRVGTDGHAVPCRARRDLVGQVCVHGTPVTCTQRHRDDDPALGTPLCVDCFDYAGAVAWNHHASELWRRTAIRITRELAALVGMSESTVKRQVRLSYVKVAEWQRRGLIHFHAAIRLDAQSPDPDVHEPPPDQFTLEVLEVAIRRAVSRVAVPYPSELLSDRRRANRHTTATTTSAADTTKPIGSPYLNGTTKAGVTSATSATSRPATTTLPSTNHDTKAQRHFQEYNRSPDPSAAADSTRRDAQVVPGRGGRGSQGLASDAGGCAAGTLDGTGHHPGFPLDPRQRVAPSPGFPNTDELVQVLAVDPTPRTTAARWGTQIDIRPIHPSHLVAVEDQLRATLADQPSGLTRGQIAGYLAKYATKDTEVLAQLRPNLDLWHLTHLAMPEHVRRLAVCAWLQARAWPHRSDEHRRMRRWTHQFGYGGHYLTKSRRYSTTFGALRQARRDWQLTRRRQQRARDAERRITDLAHTPPVEHVDADDHTDSATDPERFALVVEWRLQGIGWRLPGDALLARNARNLALAARAEAREQRHRERELQELID